MRGEDSTPRAVIRHDVGRKLARNRRLGGRDRPWAHFRPARANRPFPRDEDDPHLPSGRGAYNGGLQRSLARHSTTRGNRSIHLAGIDDAHRFHADDIGKLASEVPYDEFSILLLHAPEIYRQAADAHFKLLLSGHTHGGQICLPGGFPVTLQAILPRRMGAGPWRYEQMIGYTSAGTGSSVVPVRLNCPPEITLHRLRSLVSEGPLPKL